MDQARGVVASSTSSGSRFADVEDSFTRVVRSAEVPRVGQRQSFQEDQKRDLLCAVLRRLGGRLEDLRKSNNLWKFHDPHGATATLHKIQSEMMMIARKKPEKIIKTHFSFESLCCYRRTRRSTRSQASLSARTKKVYQNRRRRSIKSAPSTKRASWCRGSRVWKTTARYCLTIFRYAILRNPATMQWRCNQSFKHVN